MCRHIYDWNIVDCDVKQPIHLTSFCFLIFEDSILDKHSNPKPAPIYAISMSAIHSSVYTNNALYVT